MTTRRTMPPPSTEAPPTRRWWALVTISLAQLMVLLDNTIVNIALPSAQRDLGIADGDRQWVITSYMLAFGGLMLLGGRLSDLLGRRRALLTGLLGFAMASALGGAAPTAGTLFAARALQGVFAALLAPAALALLNTIFTDPAERGRAFGVFGAISGAGAAVGLTVGGPLTEYLSWRWVMYLNVPIALAAVCGALHTLRVYRRRSSVRLDVPGVLWGSGGLLLLVFGFGSAESHGWINARVLTALTGGVLLLAVFALWQRRATHPIVPPHLVAERRRVGTLLSVGLGASAIAGMYLFMTYYLQLVLGFSAMHTGLAFLPLAAGMITGSTQLAARLLPFVAPRFLLVPGLLVAAGGMAALTRIDTRTSYLTHVFPAMLVFGLGLGTAMMTAIASATAHVPAEDSGVVSALVNTAQQVGGSLGTALQNTIAASATAGFVAASNTHRHRAALQQAGMVHGFTVAMTAAAAMLLVAAVLAAFLLREAAPRQEDIPSDPNDGDEVNGVGNSGGEQPAKPPETTATRAQRADAELT